MVNRLKILQNEKKGWLIVVEAFVAVILVAGVLITVIESRSKTNDIPENVYRNQIEIINGIKASESLRSSVLGISSGNLPVSYNDSLFPANIKSSIEGKKPAYLNCEAKICAIDQDCVPSNSSAMEVYVVQSAIFANSSLYNPRKIALFCTPS